jgi:hypothetical protein
MVKVVVVKADTYDEQVVELAMKELFDVCILGTVLDLNDIMKVLIGNFCF